MSHDGYDQVSNWEEGTPRSSRSVDTVQDLLRRFTLECKPDYALKLRHCPHQFPRLVVGADAIVSPTFSSVSYAAVIKPHPSTKALWRRLKIDPQGRVWLRSKKLAWWVLTLDVEAHGDPFKRTGDVSFRLGTKWGVNRGTVRSKRALDLSPGRPAGLQGRLHYSLAYDLPEVEGSLKAAPVVEPSTGPEAAGPLTSARSALSHARLEQQVSADVGYAHLQIPRLELVIRPEVWAGRRLWLDPSRGARETEALVGGLGAPSGMEAWASFLPTPPWSRCARSKAPASPPCRRPVSRAGPPLLVLPPALQGYPLADLVAPSVQKACRDAADGAARACGVAGHVLCEVRRRATWLVHEAAVKVAIATQR